MTMLNDIRHKTFSNWWIWGTITLMILACKKEERVLPFSGSVNMSRLKRITFSSTGRETWYSINFSASFHAPGPAVGDIICEGTKLYYEYRGGFYGGGTRGDSAAFTQPKYAVWNIQGNPKYKDVPFSITSKRPFSLITDLDFSTRPVISRSAPFTLTWNNTIPCDTISILLGAGSNHIEKHLPGNVSSYTITAAQLASFDTSQRGYLHIHAYNRKDTTVTVSKTTATITASNYADETIEGIIVQ